VLGVSLALTDLLPPSTEHRMEPLEPIRVLVADAHSLMREALVAVLAGQEGIAVVAQAGDGMQAVGDAERSRPDVALLDADLPNLDTVHTTMLLRERVPGCRVVVVSDQGDERLLAATIEAGANGFLTKGCPISELVDAVRAVSQGDTLIPPEMLGSLLQRLIHGRRDKDAALRQVSRLTRREREVLSLLAGGADNDGIAQALVISPETARTHVQHVLSKLGMHSRLAVAAFVASNGLMDELVGSDA
jgi:DNA-binding NarL/FixJ family response regulator